MADEESATATSDAHKEGYDPEAHRYIAPLVAVADSSSAMGSGYLSNALR